MFSELRRQFLRMSYRFILKPIFFRIDPEIMHDLFTQVGRFLGKHQLMRAITRTTFFYAHPSLVQQVHGISFPNPVGLSAGFDKDANMVDILREVGFGFMQVGTVTLHSYDGNPRPRLYRLPRSKALVVYYGLKNIGCEAIINRLKTRKTSEMVTSISIGKTNCKETTGFQAGIDDYRRCLEKVSRAGVGNFYTINVSCPNTFGGEPYTTPKRLDALLHDVVSLKIKKPIFVKMPINLSWKQFRRLLKVVVQYKLAGVIIGNLNKDRTSPFLKEPIPTHVRGSISGEPTRQLCNRLISQTYQEYGDRLTIIGVGGVFSAEDAYEKIQRGATLVQLITGMIYEGPQVIGEINRGIAKRLERDGYKSMAEAVGAFYR